VNAAGEARGGASALPASYEELRRHALAGSGFGSAIGLVLLLREGMGSWIRTGASPPSTEPAASGTRPGAGSPVSELRHVHVVRVLASMALSGREERSS